MKKPVKQYPLKNIKITTAEEPIALFGNPFTNNFQNLVSVLGGQKNITVPVNTETDLIELARKGLKKNALNSVADFLNISMEKMSQLLDVSLRTLQRKSDTDLLSLSSSEQVIEVAEVICKGIEVFGTKDQFNLWLNAPLIAINGATPLSLLDTTFGTKIIMRLLGRIEQGVYS